MKAPTINFGLAYYPKGNVTQFFGENPELYARFGLKAHNGIDFVAPHGSPLFAIETGTVTQVKQDPGGYGKHIRIATDPDKDGRQRQWTYGHLDTIKVAQGDRVTEGQLVGTMGNTGFVVSGQTDFWVANPHAGTHLHLGLKLLKNGQVQNYENGYKGSIDPHPFIREQLQREQLQTTLISVLQKTIELMQGLIKLKR